MNTAQTVAPSDILTFRFISAYLVEGLQCPANGYLLLHSDDVQGKKVYLAGGSHECWHHIDRVQTICYIRMTAFFRGRSWDLDQFASHVSTTTQNRMQRYGAAISIRQILVMCIINATAPSRHAARRAKRKVSVAGCNVRRTKITSASPKTVGVSKTGAKPIPAIGARRSLRPKYRYKKSSKRK